MERENCIIQAGHVALTKNPTYLSSVCGNGVVVVIWNKYKKTGVMGHCLLAKVAKNEKPTNYHAEVVVPFLIKTAMGQSVSVNSLEAHLYGGANKDEAKRKYSTELLKYIKKLLAKHKVKIVSEDISGNVGRKIVFDTLSGDCMVIKTKKIRKSDWV